MNFDEYQERSKETAYGLANPAPHAGPTRGEKLLFLALALNGEAGEFGEKVKKAIRENDPSYLEDAKDELGDILWYMAQLSSLLDENLSDVAEDNLDKLFDRDERGAITGEGDNR